MGTKSDSVITETVPEVLSQGAKDMATKKAAPAKKTTKKAAKPAKSAKAKPAAKSTKAKAAK